MSKETREHISSLMDGEISREASRFLVRRLGTDEALCATWARYHVVRDCLRDHEGGFAQHDLCSRVRHAIDEDERLQAPVRSAPRWLKPIAGAAIAASVALVAVMAVQQPGAGGGTAVPGADPSGLAAEPFSNPQGISNTTVSSRAVSSQKMNSYLLRHYQATGAGNGRSFVGFVPVMVSSQPAVNPEQPEPDDGAPDGEIADNPRP